MRPPTSRTTLPVHRPSPARSMAGTIPARRKFDFRVARTSRERTRGAAAPGDMARHPGPALLRPTCWPPRWRACCGAIRSNRRRRCWPRAALWAPSPARAGQIPPLSPSMAKPVAPLPRSSRPSGGPRKLTAYCETGRDGRVLSQAPTDRGVRSGGGTSLRDASGTSLPGRGRPVPG